MISSFFDFVTLQQIITSIHQISLHHDDVKIPNFSYTPFLFMDFGQMIIIR